MHKEELKKQKRALQEQNPQPWQDDMVSNQSSEPSLSVGGKDTEAGQHRWQNQCQGNTETQVMQMKREHNQY